MNLLENNVIDVIINNYDISIGHINGIPDVYKINNGIIDTKAIDNSNITFCSLIPSWISGSLYKKNTFYINNNRIYVLLYSPGTISVAAPSGNSITNFITDDNHTWRYICDVDYMIDNKYTVIKKTNDEVIKKGCIQGIDIIKQSQYPVQSYSAFHSHTSHMKGSGLVFVVENNQNTFMPSDILIQHGGTNYTYNDYIVLTDKPHSINDYANINVYIENGQVKLDSFTNGQNYEYMDIIIIGDGIDSTATFTSVAGVLTNVSINPGSNYTWAIAIVLNSDKYIIGQIFIEPLNGYSSDLNIHLGPDRYLISSDFKTDKEINFYTIHKKKYNPDKLIYIDDLYMIDEFVPNENETITVKLVVA